MAVQPRLSSLIPADFPIPGVKLTRLQAAVWTWLKSRSHLPQGICHAAKTIANAIGYCRRSVELAIEHFIRLGVLRRERDYRKSNGDGLNTRRRFYLVTPPPVHDPEAAAPNSLGADFAPTGRNFCAEVVPPPEPPICVSGDRNEMEGGGGCAPPDSPAAPIAEADPAPPPPEFVPAPKEDEKPIPPKATPEQVEQVVAKAKEVLPAQPRGWILALARRWTLSWVRAALGRVAEVAAEGRTVKTGLVIKILRDFASEGGPPAELVAPARTGDEAMRIFLEELSKP